MAKFPKAERHVNIFGGAPQSRGRKGVEFVERSKTGFMDYGRLQMPSNVKVDYVQLEDGYLIPLALYISQFNQEHRSACWLTDGGRYPGGLIVGTSKEHMTALYEELSSLPLFQTNEASRTTYDVSSTQHPDWFKHLHRFVLGTMDQGSLVLNNSIKIDSIVILGRDPTRNIKTQTIREFFESFGCTLTQNTNGNWVATNSSNPDQTHIAAIELDQKLVVNPATGDARA